MPELPEVETTLRGIAPHITGKTIVRTTVRQAKLRHPVPPDLDGTLNGETVLRCTRRAKYLLVHLPQGILLIHLGMSGSLRIFTSGNIPDAGKHDHVEIEFSDGTLLRYHDPRRFGIVSWYPGPEETHPLLQNLAPEPLGNGFTADYLHNALKKRRSPIKSVLMDNKTVVGVGNIYATEALFASAIHPARAATTLTRADCDRLAEAIKTVLQAAIAQGGTTLRDFTQPDGTHGYFAQTLNAYGRSGEPCPRCQRLLQNMTIGGRSTVYCAHCQH